MRYYLVITVLCSCCLQLQANNYYFSSRGNDSRTAAEAQQPATPWKSIAKLNAIFSIVKPGDSILFKRSEVFDGAIAVTVSGTLNQPVIFGAYGTGVKPVINGLTTLANWTLAGANTWEAVTSAGTMIHTVLVNGVMKPIGRYPNVTAENKGYLIIESTDGNSRITDNKLSGTADWTGGEVVIRKARWVIDRNPITSYSGQTIYYASESPNQSIPGFGYFIQNHPKTLDFPGEWYFSAGSKKLGIYANGNPAADLIQASTVNTLVSISNQAFLVFDNLTFRGANNAAFDLQHAQNISITSCNILYSGINAINAASSDNVLIKNSVIDFTNNVAVNGETSNNLTIRNNKITNTATVAGSGKGDSGGYEALLLTGDNHLIELNTIENTGYIPVTFRGNRNIIRNNFINTFAFVKDDAGGIYSWNNIPNTPLVTGAKIIGNTILNGLGAGEGTDNTGYKPANGIYMDDNTANVEITGNTVAGNGLYGIYLHNAHEITITGNTVFNNKSQVVLAHDRYAPNSPVRNITMLNNIFFSQEAGQAITAFLTPDNDIASFGTFDNNAYARPVYDNFSIVTGYSVNGTDINKSVGLDEWKAMYGKDASSYAAPVSIGSTSQIRFEYNATAMQKTVPLTQPYIDVSGKAYSGAVTLAPYNSVVLIRQSAQDVTDATGNCPGTGSILREQWDNVPGSEVSDIPLQSAPGSTVKLHALETAGIGDNYGARLRGYICPPQNGGYAFMISGDNTAELWLSSDATPEKKVRIAYVSGWTGFREFNKFPAQQSAPVQLKAGERYYLEVLQKEAAGDDHVSVAWQLPDGVTEIPIPGKRLIPYTVTVAEPVPGCSATGAILQEQWSNVAGNDVQDIPLESAPSATRQLTSLETSAIGAGYGERISGFICPPQSGNYQFFISGDDAAELWLSPDSVPGKKVKIAYLLSYTDYHQISKFPSQASSGIGLIAGRKYYIEALHKQGAGGDHVSVAWQLPDGVLQIPIPGNSLSPFSPAAGSSMLATKHTGDAAAAIDVAGTGYHGLKISPNPVTQDCVLQVYNDLTGMVKAVVTDVKGRVVRKLVFAKARNLQLQRLPVDGLPAGSYVVQIQIKGITDQVVMIKR